MIKNYIKVALRTIFRNKTYSFINIFGLALGLACSFLILIWIMDELSYDKFHKDVNRLYFLYQQQLYSNNHQLNTDNLPGPLKNELMSNFPEIENATRFLPAGMKPVKFGEHSYSELICLADPEFLKMFSFPLKKGSYNAALNEPFSILLTEKMAKKYFGNEDPLGKTITIEGKYLFKITGVLKNIPSNTQFNFVDFIAPFINSKEIVGATFESWGSNWPRTYVKFKEHTDVNQFNNKIAHILRQHQISQKTTLYTYQVKDRHLYFSQRGKIQYVYIFASITLFVLLIACINFMNLSTARSNKRISEVGLRKTLGAMKRNLISQFIGESVLLSILALFLAIILMEISLPLFNKISGKVLTLSYLLNFPVILSICTITLVTGFISGIYPAFYFSSFQPSQTLKGVLKSGPKASYFRNTLVVIQFSLSIFLIAGTFIINNQMRYVNNKDLGYNKENLVYIPLKRELIDKYQTIKNEFLKSPLIKGVTATSKIPVSGGNSTSNLVWEGKDPELSVLTNIVITDKNYIKTMGMKMALGKDFIMDESINGNYEYILNEEAIRQMHLDNPVGKWYGEGEDKGFIAGVVKDFHFDTLHRKIEPMLIVNSYKYSQYILVRLKKEHEGKALAYLQNTWNKIAPSSLFTTTFLTDRLEDRYGSEKNLLRLFNVFSAIALLIACLGMFGLSLFAVEQRIKEIGVRKVLGASVPSIIILLTKDFTKWVVFANILAWPAGWIVFDRWLNHFAYHSNLNITPFILAAFFAFVISIIAVWYQSFKAAVANPITSLKYE